MFIQSSISSSTQRLSVYWCSLMTQSLIDALTFFILLSNLFQILYVAFFLPVSIYSVLGTLLYKFAVVDNFVNHFDDFVL